MGVKVAKFGGTSLASAEAFRKVKAIVLADSSRCFVVPSAPGSVRRRIKRLLICSISATTASSRV